ncbi:MAG: fasciclin domain-containing protein, partial [Bacteroidota bacterium]
AGTVDALLNDIPTLTSILLYHVVPAEVFSSSLTDGQTAPTLNGANINVTINANGVFINSTNQVTVADIDATNGVLHVINGVLLPPPTLTTTVWDVIQNSPDHNTLEVAVGLAGLDPVLDGPGTFTVFAPTDAAFAALPSPILDAVLADVNVLTFILTYHVAPVTALSTDLSDGMTVTTVAGENVSVSIQNGSVYINQALVTVADITTDNGVVHVIDAVIAPGIIANNVWDIIEGSPVHTILETAVVAAGLQSTLENTYFYTVFAPTDAAFGALPAGTLESLIANPAALTDILLYHVASGVTGSADLVDGQQITMLQGQSTTINLDMNGAMINSSNIVAA